MKIAKIALSVAFLTAVTAASIAALSPKSSRIRIDHSYYFITDTDEYYNLMNKGFSESRVVKRKGMNTYYIYFEDNSYLEFVYPYSEELIKGYADYSKNFGVDQNYSAISFAPVDGVSLHEVKKDLEKYNAIEANVRERDGAPFYFLNVNEPYGIGVYSWFTSYNIKLPNSSHDNSIYKVSGYIFDKDSISSVGRYAKDRLKSAIIIDNKDYPNKQNSLKAVVLKAKSLKKLKPFLEEPEAFTIAGKKFYKLHTGKYHQYDLLVELDN